MADNDILLEVQHLRKYFPVKGVKGPGVQAVEDVSLCIKKGETLGLVGESGCGKTTLINAIAGLAAPDSGHIQVNGRVSYVFQEPALFPWLTAEENVNVVLSDKPDTLPQARQWLEQAGLGDCLGKYPHQLSGGQKQRVAIAGLMAMLPDCMIFDEATAMLDPRGRKEVMDTVLKLNREKGITVVWITHFMEEAARCQHVFIMENGKMVLEGAPKDIFSDPERLQKLRLDAPPVAGLAHRVRQSGMPLTDGILTVEEMVKEVSALCKSPSGK